MPLYEFRCNDCGIFDEWRKMADASNLAYCPTCAQPARRLFNPPALLSGSLRLKTENREPQIVKRTDQEPEASRVQTHNGPRPWMIGH